MFDGVLKRCKKFTGSLLWHGNCQCLPVTRKYVRLYYVLDEINKKEKEKKMEKKMEKKGLVCILFIFMILLLHSIGFAWENIKPMPENHIVSAGNGVMYNGKFYVFAMDTVNHVNRILSYDPVSNTWTTGATLPGYYLGETSVATTGNYLYVVGGCVNTDCRIGTTNKVFVYDMNIINTNHRIRIATHGNGVYEADIDLTQATTFQLTVNISNGWNMVSIPGLNSPNQNVDTWWAYRDQSANVFKYSGGYLPITNATTGEGYWMKHSDDRTYNTGDEWPAGGIQTVTHSPLNGVSGWNLIGGYELSVLAAGVTTNPPGLQSGPIYKYSGGYQVATTIDPGLGYWMKLTGDGQILIPETLSKETKSVEYFSENLGKLIFKDALDFV